MYTRREFGNVVLAGLALPRLADALDSNVEGVRIGVQTYSYRDLPRPPGASDSVDVVIHAMVDSGVRECELFAPQLEPQGPQGARARGAPLSPEAAKAREDLRKWRLETPLDHFHSVRRKFEAAGLTIFAYCYNMSASFTDAEIERGLEMTKALGTNIMDTSTTLEVARRVAPLAEKHKVIVGLHNHSNVGDPNEVATPDSFAAAMKMSKYFRANLDIGHFTAANFDAIAYIREHHANITNLHLKDRKKNQGENMPWGQGETPIREVLQLLQKERWPIPAYVEYEYRGESNPVDEVRKCAAYARQSLV
jgi:sugar phosphate isomerase/epimerase